MNVFVGTKLELLVVMGSFYERPPVSGSGRSVKATRFRPVEGVSAEGNALLEQLCRAPGLFQIRLGNMDSTAYGPAVRLVFEIDSAYFLKAMTHISGVLDGSIQ